VALAGVRAAADRHGGRRSFRSSWPPNQEGAAREAAQAALEDIQLGLTGTPGAVSLTGGEAGVLSLVDDPSGRVSMPATARKDS
jgi:hypothetical protein